MLVLSRRTNETLVIDNNIRFTVLSVHGNQVRIGIEAPDDVIILREEIIHGGARGYNSNGANHNSTGAEQEANAGDTATPRPRHQEGRSQNDPYRRHDSHPEQHSNGHEHGRRRGVLGLRRRRP